MKTPIYLDNHATTPMDRRVLEKMSPCFTEMFGNAASRNHAFGWQAEELAREGRERVAALIGARPEEIVFTSGATESDNLAIKGVAGACRSKGRRIVTAATEHPAVLDTCRALEREGFEIVTLGVDARGMLDLERLRDALTPGTILLTLMAANNEIGTLHPLGEIGAICREKGCLFHTDAAQAAGKIPLDVEAMKIDLLSLSAHKMYGPKGAGALFARRRKPRVSLLAQMDGGGHEGGLRSGTLNVPGVVGLGEAARIAREEMEQESARLTRLRDSLEQAIVGSVEGARVNGSGAPRLPHNLSVSFEGVDGDKLLLALPDLAVSSGAACATEKDEPSHVLRALGVSDDLSRATIRFGLGRFNTEEEIDYAAGRVVEAVRGLRLMASQGENPAGEIVR